MENYFSSLVESHSWSTVKVDRNGLQFFYKHVLKQQWEWVNIVKPPITKKLPDILNHREISKIINGTRELRYQTYILIVYGLGLRLGEGLNLKVGDIDADKMRVHIRLAKGRKDRFVILPKTALFALRAYWQTHRNPDLLFPAGKTQEDRRFAKTHMNRGGLQKSFKVIVKSCNIKKEVTIHSLRHCYGTHLTEDGLNLRAIQHQMGHECPKTTAIYTQLTEAVNQNTEKMINTMIDRLTIKLDGER